jgi:hypothetical protein
MLDLHQCHTACKGCVKSYIKKHRLKRGDKFNISCSGIPNNYLPDSVIASLGEDPETAIAMLDPVLWANKFLDWHCFDPDGEIWKRKHLEGTLGGLPPYDAVRAQSGKSIFHRPYQGLMLRCSSNRKIFRIGRQAGKTEALCIMIMFSLVTRQNFAIEVLTPFQSQIDLIFSKLSELINSNPLLKNSEHRNVKAPNYKIELKNGSHVIGFTAGTRSGQDAGAARGQHAGMLVFDEADYLSPRDIDATLAVIINHPDATVWMSSTPTGRREKFYESCQDDEYREFHFPSSVNPNWTEKLDTYFRKELTEDGYQHEILAEFGEQEEGVYRLRYIELAQSDFTYGTYKPNPNWLFAIGVDWNDHKTGVTIAIVGLSPDDGVFRLVDHETISRSEFTQLGSCQRIAELNRFWNPFAVYVDKGFGTTQIEVLHKFGADCIVSEGANSPNARLRHIVKPFDFGSNVEVIDLFTQQPSPKPAKHFLVENSVRRFEQCSFQYPKSDKKYTDALLGYVVNRVSQAGKPIYHQQNEKAGDHLIDAVNLALVAFALEKSEFGKRKFETSISISKELGAILSGDTQLADREVKSRDSKPKTGRANIVTRRSLLPSVHGSLPAANTSTNHVKLWSWPGFSRDEPAPLPGRQIDHSRLRPRRPSRAKF